jgi:DNA repair exonuclease SbcCD ATPase subunit
MLRKLSLVNFKQHRNLEISFSEGLTLVTGANARGKTSLIKGVAFALGGVQFMSGRADSIPTRGEKKTSTKVTLNLEFQGAAYTIERTLSGAKLFKENELVATGNTAVNSEIEKLLGVNKATFNLLKHVQQGTTQALLTLGASKLHSLLEELSGAALVNKVIEKLSERISNFTSVIESMGKPTEDLEKLKADRDELSANLVEWYASITSLMQEVEIASSTYSLKEEEYINLREYNKEARLQYAAYDRAVKEIEDIQYRLKDLEDQVPDKVKEAEPELELGAALAALRNSISSLKKLQVRKEQQELSSKKTKETSSSLQKELDKIAEELVKYSYRPENLSALEVEYSNYTRKCGEAKARADDLIKACRDAECPTCHRPFNGHDAVKLNTEREEAVSLLEREKEACRIMASDLEAVRKLAKKTGELETIKRKLTLDLKVLSEWEANESNELSDTALELANIEKSLGFNYREDERVLNLEWSKAATAKAILDRIVKEAAILTRSLSAKEKVLSKKPGVLREKEEVESWDEFKTLSASLNEIKGRLSEWQGYYSVEFNKWESWCAVITKQEELVSALQEKIKDREVASNLQKFLRKNRDRFMEDIWTGIMSMASEFASVCTGGTITAVRRSEGGDFLYTEAGVEDSVVEASGAQRSIMALGLLMALNRLVPGSFPTLILDEPSAEMDDNHAAVVTQALAEAGTQLVMISHRSMESSLAGVHINLD